MHITFEVDEETFFRIVSLATLKGMSCEELVRRAVELYLKLEEYEVQPQPRMVRLGEQQGW